MTVRERSQTLARTRSVDAGGNLRSPFESRTERSRLTGGPQVIEEPPIAAPTADIEAPRGHDFAQMDLYAASQPPAAGILADQEAGDSADLEQITDEIAIGKIQTAGVVTDPDTDTDTSTTTDTTSTDTDADSQGVDTEGKTGAAVTITSKTTLHAPDGSDDTRTTVGSGEEVTFAVGGTTLADWTASTGTPGSASAANAFVWQAPEAPGTSTISAKVGGAKGTTGNLTMTVVAPDSMTGVKNSEDAIAGGVAGAGMFLKMNFGPTNVSFGNAELLEVAGGPSSVSGFFATLVAAGVDLNHHPNPSFVRIPANNSFCCDHAAISGLPKPWSVGHFEWQIPNKYRVAGSSGGGTTFFTSVQSFDIDGSGSVTVSKLGASVSRSP